MGVPFTMNDFFKNAFSRVFAFSGESSDMVVGDRVVLDSQVDDWGNEWETALSGTNQQDVDFLKTIASP